MVFVICIWVKIVKERSEKEHTKAQRGIVQRLASSFRLEFGHGQMASLLPWGLARRPPLTGLGHWQAWLRYTRFRIPAWVCNSTASGVTPCLCQSAQGRAQGRGSVPDTMAQVHTAGLAGDTESTSRWATAKACPSCSRPRERGAVYATVRPPRSGEELGLCISPTSRVPHRHPPDTPLSAVYLTPLHHVNGKPLGDCTRLYTVIPHRSWFWYLQIPLLPRKVSSKSAPTAPWWPLTGVQGATHSNHPTHIPSGAGQGDACLLWALGQHMCPFHCLLAGTNLRIFPGSQKSLLADSRPHRT